MPQDKTSFSVLFMVKECKGDWMLLKSLNRKPCFEPRIRFSFTKYCRALYRHFVQCYMLSLLLSSFSFSPKLSSFFFKPTSIFLSPKLLLYPHGNNKRPQIGILLYKLYFLFIRIGFLIEVVARHKMLKSLKVWKRNREREE